MQNIITPKIMLDDFIKVMQLHLTQSELHNNPLNIEIMDSTARKWYLLSRALEYQSKAAHALMVNYDAPVFDSQWAEEEMKHIMKYQTEIKSLKEDLKIIDNSIPF